VRAEPAPSGGFADAQGFNLYEVCHDLPAP
jgi:hypothetical protein